MTSLALDAPLSVTMRRSEPSGKAPVSVLVLTYNEERNLPRCLESVAWADDVLVIDSFSTDRSVDIAEAYGARVLQRRFDTFAGQRNYGVEQGDLRHPWVLHLDADEVVPPELEAELRWIATEGGADAYRVASKMMFQGGWLRHAGMFPAYQVRFGRRDRLRFVQVGHGQREDLPASEVETLEHALEHHSFSKGLHDWFEKHNRYSSDEALRSLRGESRDVDWGALFGSNRTARRRVVKELATRLPFRPTLRFLYMYLWRRGFLDGWAGYTYCRLLATYEYMTVVKERELRASRQPDAPVPAYVERAF